MLRGGLGDEGDHLRQLVARHGDVLENGRRPDPGEGGEGIAAGGGKGERFSIVAGAADVAGTVGQRDLLHLRGFVGDCGGVAVGLHQQQCLAVERQADC